MKYLFATKINGTEQSGIIDMDTNMVVCLCTKANSELLLQALNKHFVSQRSELLLDFVRWENKQSSFVKIPESMVPEYETYLEYVGGKSK